jgi:hypothetical protein
MIFEKGTKEVDDSVGSFENFKSIKKLTFFFFFFFFYA